MDGGRLTVQTGAASCPLSTSRVLGPVGTRGGSRRRSDVGRVVGGGGTERRRDAVSSNFLQSRKRSFRPLLPRRTTESILSVGGDDVWVMRGMESARG